MKPRLTIAIPTYRRPEYLREALASISADARQVLDRLEVVVSDNASRDETEQVAASFSELPLDYHCNSQNEGAVQNVLAACERCSGDYVFLLFDDDLVTPGALAAVLNAVDELPDLGVLASPVETFADTAPESPSGRLRFSVADGQDRVLSKGSEAFERLFLRATHGSGLVLRRNLLDVEGARKHAASLYPQMYLAGKAAKMADGYYFAEPLVKVRANPVVHWQYSHDYMAAAVLDMLSDLTDGETWGPAVERRLVRRRVLAAYGPLFQARQASIRAFGRTVRGLASVPAYRKSVVFWGMVFVVGLLGTRCTRALRRVLPVGSAGAAS